MHPNGQAAGPWNRQRRTPVFELADRIPAHPQTDCGAAFWQTGAVPAHSQHEQLFTHYSRRARNALLRSVPGGSHSSWIDDRSPQNGSGRCSRCRRDRQQPDPGGSHSSSPSIAPLPHRRSQGNTARPVIFSKLLRRTGQDGRGCTSQSCASQYALHRPKAAPVRPLQTVSCDGGMPSGVFADAPGAVNRSPRRSEQASLVDVPGGTGGSRAMRSISRTVNYARVLRAPRRPGGYRFATF
jgi:hypothetical protein